MHQEVKQDLIRLLEKYSSDFPVDALRNIAETSKLLHKTYQIRELIEIDAFGIGLKDSENGGELTAEGKKLRQLEVIEYEEKTGLKYADIHGVIHFNTTTPSDTDNNKNDSNRGRRVSAQTKRRKINTTRDNKNKSAAIEYNGTRLKFSYTRDVVSLDCGVATSIAMDADSSEPNADPEHSGHEQGGKDGENSDNDNESGNCNTDTSNDNDNDNDNDSDHESGQDKEHDKAASSAKEMEVDSDCVDATASSTPATNKASTSDDSMVECTEIRYSIEVSHNYGAYQPVLTVQIRVPSIYPMNGEDEKELKMQSFGEAESVYGDEEEEEEEGMASMQGDSYHDRDRPSYDDFMKDRDNAADADALGDGVADTSNADDDDNEAEIMNDADCSDEADADECSDDVDGGRAEAGNHADGLEIGFENTLKNKHAPLVWDVNLDTDGLTQLAQLIETELEGVEMVYFLVSLPFYEQEWEMERWIIEQIFGSVSEEDMEAMEAGEHAAAAAGADGAGDSDDGDIDAVDDDNTSDAGEK